MDDCVVWGATAADLRGILARCEQFLETELRLQVKPEPLIKPTRHGLEFLGCRVFPTHLSLNRRSRARFRHRLEQLEAAYLCGRIDERHAARARQRRCSPSRGPAEPRVGDFERACYNDLSVSGQWARTG